MYGDGDAETRGGEVIAAREPEKPSHVRKLNFGQSILTLDGVRQFQGQKDGVLLINNNVTGIPSTSRLDFVRKWLETHSNHGSNSRETPCVSPVLGLSMSQPVETSPVFGNKCKRTREKAGLRVMTGEGEHWRSGENSFDTSKSSKRIKVDSSSRKENVKKKLFDSPSAIELSESKHVSASPVLLRKSYCYKRRRRKPGEENSQRKVLECIKNKYTEAGTVSPVIGMTIGTPKRSPVLDKNAYSHRKRQHMQRRRILGKTENRCVDTNMNSLLSCDLLHSIPTRENILSSQKQNMLIKKLEDICENDNSDCLPSEESEITEESVKLRSPLSKVKLNIENSSPKDCEKDLGRIEIESSNEENSSPNDITRINNDTDTNFSDHIEDVDSQDVDLLARKKNPALDKLRSDVSERVSSRSQSPNKDSDRTFFSEAEQVRSFPSVQSSQRISQISSQAIDNRHNRSSQTGIIISTASTPPKVTEDPTMQLTDLDSAKKRRKPKRGSLVEKLQSAINRQVSFIRMWKHQLRQAVKDNNLAQCATIFVRGCTIRFGRQFLEGIVAEDPFNLLPRKGENRIKFVKMMLIPDIVGRVELNSGGLVQIFPPWETLDDDDFVLNITYIRVMEDERDVEQYKRNENPIKRSIVKDFDCPCIQLNRSISSCKNRVGKPNVIEKLVTGA